MKKQTEERKLAARTFVFASIYSDGHVTLGAFQTAAAQYHQPDWSPRQSATEAVLERNSLRFSWLVKGKLECFCQIGWNDSRQRNFGTRSRWYARERAYCVCIGYGPDAAQLASHTRGCWWEKSGLAAMVLAWRLLAGRWDILISECSLHQWCSTLASFTIQTPIF